MPIDRPEARYGTSHEQLRAALQDLHLRAGKPSARSISRALGDVSHTTVADLLAGRRIASWDIVRRTVVHLGGDETEIQDLWMSAVGETHSRDVLGVAPPAALQAPMALAQLPALAAGFTGRDEELEVLARLLGPARGAGPVVVSAVAGLAGVGKTTLAVAAGHAAVQQGWFSGVLFLDLHGYEQAPVGPGEALDALLQALGVPGEHMPPGTEERAGLYRSVVAKIAEPLLVIADNACSEAQVRLLLPGAGPHKVLVTSRHTLAGLGARLVDLSVLDQQTSVELLDRALRIAHPGDDRISRDPEAAWQLAEACGGLPLALQITAALLSADAVLTAAELADQLGTYQDRLTRLQYDDGSGPSAPSVAAAFELSYHRLDDTAARLFRLLSVVPGPDISTVATAALAGLLPAEVRTVLASLARAHLIEAAPGTGGRWRMHDLLRLYARQLSDQNADSDGREQAIDRLLDYWLDMAEAADAHLRTLNGAEMAARFADRDDALAWLDAEQTSLIPAVRMAAATGRDHVAMRLPLRLAEYFNWRRRFDDCLAVTAISLSAARRLRDRGNEAMALNNLGAALREARRFEEAITACQDAAAIYRQIGDRHGEAMALNNLGAALREARRFEEAITAYQEAIETFREIDDEYSARIALANLNAVPLPDVDRVLGREHPDTLTARSNLARWTGEAGDPATARDRYVALLHDCERVLGPEDPDTLTARSNLARLVGGAGYDKRKQDPPTSSEGAEALIRRLEGQLAETQPTTSLPLTSSYRQLSAESYWNLRTVAEMENWDDAEIVGIIEEYLYPSLDSELSYNSSTFSGTDWRHLRSRIKRSEEDQ